MRGQGKRRQKKVVGDLIKKIEEKLKDGEMKPTLGDYIRLLQLQKEMEADEPRDIEVRWVESEQKDPSQ
ncbi:MAG TPA: hypothetical protein VH639_26480 [Bryobacteraceae bacterium]